ncbi:MAG: response regulator [Desulfobacterota bacterium]|jgi:DNA-binding NtrC family response regulator|nr:response regulator [Thermodesulfobacteriota bacterium]
MTTDLLKDKKVLVVDDEADVLETLEDLLSMCPVVKASTFAEAKRYLDDRAFDIAILDIMGVDGYRLLEMTAGKKILTVMLTAHALSPEDTVKSFKEGAASFVPKDKMQDIATYLADILEAKEKGKSSWWRWLERFASYYDKKFGPEWRRGDETFWKTFGPWE